MAGCTGTAQTESAEFFEIYNLPVLQIPTNKDMIRNDLNDQIFRTSLEKDNAIIQKIRECNEIGQPLLVFTSSINKSEHYSNLLEKEKIKHIVLNAKNHEKEAEIIALKYYSSFSKKTNINISRTKSIFRKIHLVETADLTKKEIEHILNESKKYILFNKKRIKKINILEGRTIFNLFFEDSTRTRTSFEVAAKRLGADLINVVVKDSSINKGETLLDTMTTINSMNPDCFNS